MLVIEILTVLLVLVVAMAAAMYIGLGGILGVTRLVRCDPCGHRGLTSASKPLQSCLRCRHGSMLHPFYALHRVHSAHEHAREEHLGSSH